ncbi:hypothetical protein C8035_v010584 [Colletotrichum spinosum]|uniref:Heterokaryon incompatibility domain-containing protein n=1 Tax=Colletotrichum spinosum TaxID=1347390 RepID=A0A4V3HS56_9PEZI|nr:hypothetical protein C8035_v010584 [Colletotrichum spinosum]
MYAVAKSLEISNVKLCINASHLWSRQTLEDVRVFDEIMVQVGPLHVETGDEHVWSMPQLRLTVDAPRDDVTYIGNLRIGRFRVDTNLGSAFNHNLARQWLSDCRLGHESCLSSQLHELPTRVINVGTWLDSPSVSLFLSRGLKADYVALSHCWGGAISPLLTTDTLEAFQSCMPMAALPANFRDAITITRNLGIRHLWIDSLCIQQDSKSDWEVESKKMGLVYRNSTVTISAMVSTGSKDGILKSGDPIATRHAAASLPVYGEGGEGLGKARQVTVYRMDPDEETLGALDLKCALTRRGWTLQEYMLSPRHILYGKDKIYWRCPGTFCSSDGLSFGNKTPQRTYATLSRVIYSDIMSHQPPLSADVSLVLQDYYELVNAYSARALTYGTDKLPAFSGLAQRLHPAIKGDYLAGIWTTDFRRGLLWTAEMRFCRRAPGPYRAPSWSWAVTDEMVLFEAPESILGPSPSSATLLAYNVEPRVPGNPYGEVVSATLVLEALTKPLVRSSQIIATVSDPGTVGTVDYDEPAGPEDSVPRAYSSLFFMRPESGGDYVLSVITKPGGEPDWDVDLGLFREEEYLLMLVHTDDSEPEDPEWSNSRAVCLVIRQTRDGGSSSGCYERVGFAKLQQPRLRWLETWQRRVLTLV